MRQASRQEEIPSTPATGTKRQAVRAVEELPSDVPVGGALVEPCYESDPAGTCPPEVMADPCCDRSGLCHAGYCLCGLWVSADYLLWWVEGFSTPPLVTTSPAGTDRADAGVLGRSGTEVLFGDDLASSGARSGGRIRLGYWFDPLSTCGLEAVFLGLGSADTTYSASSDGSTILARPFFNIEEGSVGQDSELIAYPDLLSGGISVRTESVLQGAEVLYRQAVWRQCEGRIDFMAGWRYNQLDDDLTIAASKRSLSGNSGLALGTTVEETDVFSTRNQFNGVELGVAVETQRCNWLLDASLKLAIGNSHSEITIHGETTTTVPLPGGGSDVEVTGAGLLAQPTNIGTRGQSAFAVVPELAVHVGYDLSPRLRATFGYTFLYWSRVARPGDQIDTDLNLTQIEPTGLIGAPRPEFTGALTDIWAQGLNVGLDCRF